MVRIISDSSTLYSEAQAKEKGFDIVPLCVTIGGETYRENEDITTEEFIKLIKEGHIPTSSQPAIGQVVDMFERYKNDEIINISMADGLSGTYNSACCAKDIAEKSENITVVNSMTLCGPQRYIVENAVELAKIGKSKDEILNSIDKMIKSSRSFLIPKDFDYLVRGGRLSPLVGKIGSAIKLVPVLTLSEDSTRLTKFTTKRTFQKAVDKICDSLIESGVDSNYKVYITHACTEELEALARKIITERIPNIDVESYILGPVFTTQGGPDCVAIQTIKKMVY